MKQGKLSRILEKTKKRIVIEECLKEVVLILKIEDTNVQRVFQTSQKNFPLRSIVSGLRIDWFKSSLLLVNMLISHKIPYEYTKVIPDSS